MNLDQDLFGAPSLDEELFGSQTQEASLDEQLFGTQTVSIEEDLFGDDDNDEYDDEDCYYDDEDEDEDDEFDVLIPCSIEPVEQVVQSAGVIINGDVTVIRDSAQDLTSDERAHGDFLDELFTTDPVSKLVVEQTALDAVKVSTPNELGKIIVNNNEDYAVSKVEIIVLSDGQPVGYLVSGE